jgi:hypothetical protein
MKKILYQTLLFITLSCFNFGCNNSDNTDYKTLIHSDLNLSEEYVGDAGGIIALKNGIIGIEWSNSLEPFFMIKKEGEKDILTRFGVKGQGPDDVIHVYPIQYLNDSVFGAFDMSSNKYKEVQIPKDMEPLSIKNVVSIENRQLRVRKTAYDQYIGLSFGEGLLSLIDETGKETATFFEYPYKDKVEQKIKNHIRAMAYQGELVLNPQKDKCVYAPMNGEIIHFYKIEKDNITLINKIEKIYPEYGPEEKSETNYSATFSWQCVSGYSSIAATDKYVYAIYCGRTLKELQDDNDSTLPIARQLRKFDWTGQLIETYMLDVPCYFIAVTPDDKTLWASALNPDFVPVYFDLTRSDTKKRDTKINTEDTLKQKTNDEKNKTDNLPMNKINAGKIRVGEEKTYFFGIEGKGVSTSTTGKGIILRDSTLSSGKSIIFISVTKQQPEIFNDTVIISYDSTKIPIVISGEAVLFMN